MIDFPASPRLDFRDAAGRTKSQRKGEMRIAIFGTGGAGGYFGAQLALAGEDVVFIARGDHLRAMKAIGLRFETPSGETIIQTEATDKPAEIGNVDAVLVGQPRIGHVARVLAQEVVGTRRPIASNSMPWRIDHRYHRDPRACCDAGRPPVGWSARRSCRLPRQ
jgi:Ketopantoate reductase PanE/ApbA